MRSRLAWQFTLITATILICFFISIYFFYSQFRRYEFNRRLETKAESTARLLLEVKEIDQELMKIIEENSLSALYEEELYIFDKRNRLVYQSPRAGGLRIDAELLQRIRFDKLLPFTAGRKDALGLTFGDPERPYIVLAAAYDIYGRRKLDHLQTILLLGGLISLAVIYVGGQVFAGEAVQPLVHMNRQIAHIDAHSLNTRLYVGDEQDEIAQLSANFNQMLDRLADAFAQQKVFVQNASHELRTPLAAIISQVQVGLAKTRTEEEYQEMLQSVLEDAQRLTALSNSLLTLAKAEVDTQTAGWEQLRLDELYFEAQALVQQKYPQGEIRLNFDLAADDEHAFTIQGNESMLKMLILNLLDNALKFSDKPVDVILGSGDNTVKLAVHDQGPGIPEEEQEKIFWPFYRSDNTRRQPGHGLGLSICRKIAERHGGSLTVQSEAGKGSTFTLTLLRSEGMEG